METILLTCISTSPEETEAQGRTLAEQMCSNANLPPFVALFGDLGVGKTAFVRGFSAVIAPNSAVRSPTFALVNEYRSKPRSVFHFDMYRITSEDDLISIGFEDYLNRAGICLVEWSENISEFLPSERLEVAIEKLSLDRPNDRQITIKLIGDDKT